MQIRHIGRGIKGFYRVANYALRWAMVHKDAQRRLEILKFWHTHGLVKGIAVALDKRIARDYT